MALGSPTSSRKAFVFSGGGTFGAAQVGMLRALFEHDIRPDVVVGTSAGALNAAFPPTRAFALAILPGVRETAATIDAAFPWIRATSALLQPSELQGLAADLAQGRELPAECARFAAARFARA